MDAGDGEAEDAEDGGVDQEEEECLVVVEAETVGEPGAVVVHLQDTGATGGTVVGSVGFVTLAFFAEAGLTGGFDRYRGRLDGGEGDVGIFLGIVSL